MLDTYIKNRGTTKTIIHNNNHNTVNETKWDADYDGTVANVSLDLSKNGRNKHLDFKLTNNDLANILTVPSVSQPIHKRLKMDFNKPESFKQIFLELDTDSDSSSSSDSDSSSDSESESEFPLENMDTLFNNDVLNNNDVLENDFKQSSPIQELLTHISSPTSNEEFIMPFQDYSLDKQPIIKIVHRQPSKSHRQPSKSHRTYKKSKSHRSSKKSKSRRHFKNHRSSKSLMFSKKHKHHNYPSTRKSPRRHTTSRRI